MVEITQEKKIISFNFKTERNRVDKQKSLKKKKIVDVQIKKLITAPYEAI